MIFKNEKNTGMLNEAFSEAYLADEQTILQDLIEQATLAPSVKQNIEAAARKLVKEIREQRVKKSSLDAFLYEYELSSEEGIALMCLAEAMLRVPDSDTADDLIRDKITSAEWGGKPSKADSFFVNASTWALMLTGKVLARSKQKSLGSVLKSVMQKTGEPVIRSAVGQAMKVLGKQFVMGRNIDEALERAKDYEAKGYTYSYDMLGEAARTQKDADNYFKSYVQAIEKIGASSKQRDIYDGPGISVKLSALHPRYEYAKRERVLKELTPRLLKLACLAKQYNISLTVDAEEARVLSLSLEIFKAVYADNALAGWEGFGLAIQAYQKRAPYVVDFILALYEQHQRRIMVRLIKGAYWDAEIKYAQVNGLPGYPVFTRKNSTDVSYIACMRKILKHRSAIYPMFGSHNAYTVAAVLTLAKEHRDYEFQCLHGMGHALYDHVVGHYKERCRIYAPVGGHRELLAYLVRRLLENGANTSFVNRLADSRAPIDELIADPVELTRQKQGTPHPRIPLPRDIYGASRKNAEGIDLTYPKACTDLAKAMDKANQVFEAYPIVNGKAKKGSVKTHQSPYDSSQTATKVIFATEEDVNSAFESAHSAQREWDQTPVTQRADCLRRAADLLEARMPQLMMMATREAGKTLSDGVAEVREAVDFCRYYAAQAENDFEVKTLPGPTGELNQLSLHGRGVMVCISPWNFPLAIFMGQVVAALVAGNAVMAKPAEQTCAIATAAVRLLHDAGIPKAILHLLPGEGEVLGPLLLNHPYCAGVMFTGSTDTARILNQTLAARSGPILPLIAETGGQNCMIVDSTALLEQVVLDVVSSAFGSAGQRCSALRVLYIQADIADQFIEMLKGAMAELRVGVPEFLNVDVGPVIDQAALTMLEDHYHEMQTRGQLIAQANLDSGLPHGHFFPPCVFEIDDIQFLEKEFFGPFLHLIRYKNNELDKVLKAISSTGFGLTQGLHSRISERISLLQESVGVGNLYVNRNMIGAVVGVQPFGGEGLSGTGPKAGGPHYLPRLAVERTLSVDTTASGGNASLLTLEEDD